MPPAAILVAVMGLEPAAAVATTPAGTAPASPARVTFVTDGQTDALATPLRAELGALGFDVVTVASNAAPSRRDLETQARASGAVAALRMVASPAGVEVWIADRVTGKVVLREIVAGTGGAEAARLVVLRAVELLRASLMEIDAPHPSRGELAAPPEVVALALPDASARPSVDHARVALGLGPALGVSSGGVPPSLHIALSLRLVPRRLVGAHVLALLPTFPQKVTAAEGEAHVTILFVGAGVDLLPRPHGRLSPSAGAGLAWLAVRMAGFAQAPFRGQVDDVHATAAYGRLGLDYAVGARVGVGLDLAGGIAIPRPVVAFAGRPVASFGRPFAAITAVTRIAWP